MTPEDDDVRRVLPLTLCRLRFRAGKAGEAEFLRWLYDVGTHIEPVPAGVSVHYAYQLWHIRFGVACHRDRVLSVLCTRSQATAVTDKLSAYRTTGVEVLGRGSWR